MLLKSSIIYLYVSIQETPGPYKCKVISSSLLKLRKFPVQSDRHLFSQRLAFAVVKLFKVTQSSKGHAMMGIVVPSTLPAKSMLPRVRSQMELQVGRHCQPGE